MDGKISTETAQQALALPLAREIRGVPTVRAYLGRMLSAAWSGEFNPKYGMTGESDWRYDLYISLIQGHLVPGVTLDEDGCIPDDQWRQWEGQQAYADSLVTAAIGEFIRQAGTGS